MVAIADDETVAAQSRVHLHGDSVISVRAHMNAVNVLFEEAVNVLFEEAAKVLLEREWKWKVFTYNSKISERSFFSKFKTFRVLLFTLSPTPLCSVWPTSIFPFALFAPRPSTLFSFIP